MRTLANSIDESAPAEIHFFLPVIARPSDKMEHSRVDIVRIAKPAGQLAVQTGGPAFDAIPSMLHFNLVRGSSAYR